jgi:cell division transport system permease protein
MQAFHDAWTHMRRNPYQTLASVVTMFVTMLLAGLFLLASTGSSLTLRYFESKPQITVFFTDKASISDAESLKKTLIETGKVASTKYVSKEDALVIYKEQNKSDPLLLEMVTADILPASLEVSATDPKFLRELEPMLTKAPGVEEVVFQKDVVDTLLKWTNAVRWVGAVLVTLFSINSILIIMTVIGMKIALKREEIEILNLVGASPWYIRWPFIIEGGMYGVAGAVVSWVIITLILFAVQPHIFGFLGMIPIISTIFTSAISWPFAGLITGLFFVLGIVGFLLGSVGSLVALGRYLKF